MCLLCIRNTRPPICLSFVSTLYVHESRGLQIESNSCWVVSRMRWWFVTSVMATLAPQLGRPRVLGHHWLECDHNHHDELIVWHWKPRQTKLVTTLSECLPGESTPRLLQHLAGQRTWAARMIQMESIRPCWCSCRCVILCIPMDSSKVLCSVYSILKWLLRWSECIWVRCLEISSLEMTITTDHWLRSLSNHDVTPYLGSSFASSSWSYLLISGSQTASKKIHSAYEHRWFLRIMTKVAQAVESYILCSNVNGSSSRALMYRNYG